MLQRFITWIREVLNRMFHFNQSDAKRLGAEINVSSEMQKAISLWLKLFQDDAPWLGDTTQSLGLPAAIAAEFARLVLVEFDSQITGSARADWLNEEYKPENLKPFIEEHIGNALQESKEDKLSNIDSLLEMLDNDKTKKPVFESGTSNEPYFIAAMPENIRPLWESASDEMKAYITEKAHMYTLNTDEKIKYFWENKVDFKKELEPSKNINEGLDTITDQFEKNLRMALRRR